MHWRLKTTDLAHTFCFRSSAVPDMNPNYWQLLQEIKNKIRAGCFGTAQEVEKRSILRIGQQYVYSFLIPCVILLSFMCNDCMNLEISEDME